MTRSCLDVPGVIPEDGVADHDAVVDAASPEFIKDIPAAAAASVDSAGFILAELFQILH